MGKGDVIVSATDFNRSVNELESLNDSLYSLKKELEDINSGICVNKEELNSKLDLLDNYFIKLANVHKQVIGDKSIDKQYQNLLNKINEAFNSKIEDFNSKIEEVENAKNDHLSLVQKEREDLVVVGTSLKGQTNADGLNKVLLQLVSTVQDVNTTLADAKATNKELIAVKKSGIYPLFSGVLLGMFLLTLAKFLIKGTFF